MYVHTGAAGTIQLIKCSLSFSIISIHVARPSFSVDDRGNFLGQKCVFDTNRCCVCSQISGILIIGLGTTILAIYNHFDSFLEDRFFSPANLLIAVGCIVFVVAFFGCCGAARESTCMIMIVSSPLYESIFKVSKSLFSIAYLRTPSVSSFL